MTTESARRRAFRLASQSLADEMALKPGDTFKASSKSRQGHKYEMVVTPDGFVVHMDEGCQDEFFRGVGHCRHSTESEKYVTSTALVRTENVLTPAPIAFSDEQMKVITNTIAKGATPTELDMFVNTCKRTGLDPFMRQIYFVKRYDSSVKAEVGAVQIGIDGQRLIAERTGKYDGQDPVEWLDKDGTWSIVWTGVGDYPVAARCSVYRKDWAQGRKATAVVRWDSYVQTYRRDGKENLMPTWAKMPDVMLGKCAESLALRRAFPAEMSAIAAMAGSTYDPSLEEDYVEPEGRAGVIEGEVVTKPEASTVAGAEPPAASPAVISKLLALWRGADKTGDPAAKLRARFSKAFPQPGTGGVPTPNVLTADEADEAIAILSAKPECAHERQQYDETATVLRCEDCGQLLDGPPEPEQPKLV